MLALVEMTIQSKEEKLEENKEKNLAVKDFPNSNFTKDTVIQVYTMPGFLFLNMPGLNFCHIFV